MLPVSGVYFPEDGVIKTETLEITQNNSRIFLFPAKLKNWNILQLLLKVLVLIKGMDNVPCYRDSYRRRKPAWGDTHNIRLAWNKEKDLPFGAGNFLWRNENIIRDAYGSDRFMNYSRFLRDVKRSGEWRDRIIEGYYSVNILINCSQMMEGLTLSTGSVLHYNEFWF